ncbi:alpha/beta hydrolase [uncultured Desulfuromusa sp.]|uniref:alpha/beta hydrolase n=1 Tax=uncultured Desulfuromusa sp. TaxID=219183 RepID=UPI002AA8EDAB|nr:alpha/beta hydrolase [uncultured Desulfuromusa sp.]
MQNLLNHDLISARYFFPRKGCFKNPFWVDCGDAKLACSYHEINPEAKTLVHFHGNGEIIDDWQGDFVTLVQKMGCNCFLAELRGYGQSTGLPQLGKMLEDVVPTVEALQRPASELIFFGRSVGSIFAIEAVSRFPQASGLILESGVADVLERLLLRVEASELGVSVVEFEQEVDRVLNHQHKMMAYPGPVLVMHTQNDGLVDVSHGQRLYDWTGGKKTLKIFPRGNHNDIMYVNAQEYFSTLAGFIRSYPDLI